MWASSRGERVREERRGERCGRDAGSGHTLLVGPPQQWVSGGFDGHWVLPQGPGSGGCPACHSSGPCIEVT